MFLGGARAISCIKNMALVMARAMAMVMAMGGALTMAMKYDEAR